MKYYKNAENELFVDPIVENHEGLVEIDKQEFDEILEIINTPTPEEVTQQRISELKGKLAATLGI